MAFDEHGGGGGGGDGGGRIGDGQQGAPGGILLGTTVLQIRENIRLAVCIDQADQPPTRHSLQVLYGRSGRPSRTKSASGLLWRQLLQRCRSALWMVEAARFRDGCRVVKHMWKEKFFFFNFSIIFQFNVHDGAECGWEGAMIRAGMVGRGKSILREDWGTIRTVGRRGKQDREGETEDFSIMVWGPTRVAPVTGSGQGSGGERQKRREPREQQNGQIMFL